MRVKNQNEKHDEIAVRYCDPETCEACNPTVTPEQWRRLLEAAQQVVSIYKHIGLPTHRREVLDRLEEAIEEIRLGE